MFERIQKLYTKEEFKRIQNLNILLIGVGGVGGYTLEALIRSGITNITVIDYDVFESSNINRQILSTTKNLGEYKVDIAKERSLQINPEVHINPINKKLKQEDVTIDLLKEYDVVIDACDDTKVKTELLIQCAKNKIDLISCMGTGNRFKPELLEILPLKKTQNDPLAKKIRHEVREVKEALNMPVVCSKEIPIKGVGVGTCCPVPMAAGALLASHALKKRS